MSERLTPERDAARAALAELLPAAAGHVVREGE